jgi:hypothetical protein
VVLLPADNGDQPLAEALVRLQKELATVGFDVFVGPSPVHDPRHDLEVAAATDAMAAIALVRADDQGAVEVWVLDRLTGKTVIRTIHIALNSDKAPTILAVRTTEVLRASLLEATSEPPADASPPDVPPVRVPEPVAKMVSPTNLTPFSTVFLGVGGSLLYDDAIGATADITVRAGRGITKNFALRASISASVLPQVVSRPEGKASIQQQSAILDAVWTPFGPSGIVPFFAGGIGLQRAEVSGADVSTGYQGLDAQSWAFASNIGLGGAFRLSDRVWWLVDAYAQWAVPQFRVQIDAQSVGLLGAPNWRFGTHLQITL